MNESDGSEPLSIRVTAFLNLSLNAINFSRNAAASGEFRQLRNSDFVFGEVTNPDAISHLSSAWASGRSSLEPSVRMGFVFRKSRIGLFATNRNPSTHSFTS
jgi:hypothetical protein